MKSKRGFTLIELLAVIVILAIIALISVPMILKYIENSKKESFERSIDSIEIATELKVIALENQGEIIYPKTINITELDVKNKDKLIGTVTIYKDDNGKYDYTYNITNGDYTINGSKDDEVKKDQPILTLKTKNGIIDDKNNYIYSYMTQDDFDNMEIWELDCFFEAINGTLEFTNKTEYGYTTGSNIILKDKNNKVIKEYTVIIFGDIDRDAYIDVTDYYALRDDMISNSNLDAYDKYQIFAADVNGDGNLDQKDAQLLLSATFSFCWDQTTRLQCK